MELPYVAWITGVWVSSGSTPRLHACQLTGVENKSFDPRGDVDSRLLPFDRVFKPLQQKTNVFGHGRLILRDVFGRKLLILGFNLISEDSDVTAAETSFLLASL